MKIRTKFLVSILIEGGISFVVLMLLMINFFQLKGHIQYSTDMTSLAQKAFVLHQLSNDYVNKPNARVETQWQSVYAEINQKVDNISSEAEPGAGYSSGSFCNACHIITGASLTRGGGVAEVKSILGDVLKIFTRMQSGLISSSEADGDGSARRQEVLNAYMPTLDLYLQQLIDSIGQQSTHVNENAMGIVQVSSLWAIFMVFLLVASSLPLLYFTNNYLIRSIARLKDGVKMVAQGDLGFSLEHRQRDEFGELVAGFNQMTKDLHEVYGKYRDLFETMMEGVVYQDGEGRIISMNPAAESILGTTTAVMLGKTFLDAAWQFANEDGSILTGEGHPAVVALRTGQVAQGKVVRISHPGKQGYHWVVINAVPKFEKNVDYPSQVFTIYSDVTTIKQAQDEQEKLQIQLMQANKMESIGRLAGGVAHDFNNMLQTILGNIELALIETTTGSRLRDRLEEVHKAALRSADLTRQLLAFARKQPINPIVLDLNDAVLSIFEMLQRLIGEDIDLVWVPGPDLWHVRVDPSQVDQVLTNLMVNARDAIDGVGKIVVVTSNIVCDEATCALNPGMDPDEYVVLAVSDNGTGMDQETISRLFEPFFTTKEIGRGTGLGLSTVFGIVKQNNGYIKVSSEPGQGTTFNIYLRRVEAEVAPIIVIKTMETAPGGVEMVLVVEDEEALLEMVKETLEDQGYRVLAAGTPAEALRLVQEEQAGEIELLITDVVMPEMNGRVLADKLRTIQPGLKCLFMSGYTADIITDHGVLDEGVYFIQKPFSLNGLASIVRKVLEKK